ncbi:MAG: type 4a pilus biogenesis protein PilO [Candidatus Omnitrophota bacterium]
MKPDKSNRAIAGMFFCTLVLIFFYAFFYRPQAKRMERFQGELKDVTGNLKEAEGKSALLPSARKRISQLEEEFVFLQKKVPEEEDLPSAVQSLVKEAKRLGIIIVALAPSEKKEGKSELTSFSLKVELESSYQTLARYLKAIEELPRLFTVEDLMVEKSEEGSNLRVQIMVNSYNLAK